MKTNNWMVGIAAGISLSAGVLAAEDFSVYSNETLQQKRSEVRNMSEADRAAYRSEMQKRMGSMSDEERAQLRQGGGQGQSRYRANEDMGQGTTTRERSMDGSGTGGQYGGGGFNAADDLPSLGGDAAATRYDSGQGQGKGQGKGDGSGRGKGNGSGNGQGGGRQMGRQMSY